MKSQVYLPLLDSSKKFLKSKKVYRYHLKKISEMSDNEIIQVCHRYVEENRLNDEWWDLYDKIDNEWSGEKWKS